MERCINSDFMCLSVCLLSMKIRAKSMREFLQYCYCKNSYWCVNQKHIQLGWPNVPMPIIFDCVQLYQWRQNTWSYNCKRVRLQNKVVQHRSHTPAKMGWGNSLVLHGASVLRTIFVSLVRAHGRVHAQNVRDFPQTKLDSEINSPFLLNEHGEPRIFLSYLLRTVW